MVEARRSQLSLFYFYRVHLVMFHQFHPVSFLSRSLGLSEEKHFSNIVAIVALFKPFSALRINGQWLQLHAPAYTYLLTRVDSQLTHYLLTHLSGDPLSRYTHQWTACPVTICVNAPNG